MRLKGLRDLAWAAEENFTKSEVSIVGSDPIQALTIVIRDSVLSSTLALLLKNSTASSLRAGQSKLLFRARYWSTSVCRTGDRRTIGRKFSIYWISCGVEGMLGQSLNSRETPIRLMTRG